MESSLPNHHQILVQDWAPHLIQLLMNHYFHYLLFIIAFANPQLHLHFLSAHHPLHPFPGCKSGGVNIQLYVPCDVQGSCKSRRRWSLAGVNDQSCAEWICSTQLQEFPGDISFLLAGTAESCWGKWPCSNIPDVSTTQQLSNSLLLCFGLLSFSKIKSIFWPFLLVPVWSQVFYKLSTSSWPHSSLLNWKPKAEAPWQLTEKGKGLPGEE